MIDIGVNLTHPSLFEKLEHNIVQWQQEGVQSIIAIASDLEESQSLIGISGNSDNNIYHTIGCHPHHANDWQAESVQQAQRLIKYANHCIAIGETGLDFNRNYSSQDQQINAFQDQLQLAIDLDLPIYLHERDAETTLQSMLRNQIGTDVDGVLHCFTASKEALKRYLDFGLYIGVTGWLCDERRGQELQESIRYIPKDRILFETDAPYLLPRTLRPRPKKNHPKYLPHIIEQAALFSQWTKEELIAISVENSKRLFRLP